jgi:ABC-type sugar transport system ATPase subunit
LKSQGIAIIYISHHLSEVFEIADRVTVLRDGKLVFSGDIDSVSPEKVVELMVGQELDHFYARREANVGEVMFKAERITRYGFFSRYFI